MAPAKEEMGMVTTRLSGATTTQLLERLDSRMAKEVENQYKQVIHQKIPISKNGKASTTRGQTD